MPNKSAVIDIGKDGICNQCKNHKKIVCKGERSLIETIKSNIDKKSNYDCIVNISGGRDSAYTLLSLVKDYNFKVLAVNYANPFTDEQAKKNIKNMVRILKVDFIRFKLNHRIHERTLKNNIIAWFNNPSPSMVPVICIGCKVIWYNILKIAHKNKVKCVVNGGNPYEYTSFKKELLGVSSDASLKSTYFKNIVGLIREGSKNLSYLKPQYLPMTIKGYLFGNQYAIGSRLLGRNIKRIDYFHYISWDEKMVITRIKKELDWGSPKNLSSTWRFDCEISHLKDYMYLKTIGITEKDDFYSKLIRENQISRDKALNRIKKENKIHFDIINELFAKLGIVSINIEENDGSF